MDGFQLCAALRSDPELGRVPVVLLSGGQGNGQVDRGLHERSATAGASDCLPKPIDLPRLVQVVRRLSA